MTTRDKRISGAVLALFALAGVFAMAPLRAQDASSVRGQIDDVRREIDANKSLVTDLELRAGKAEGELDRLREEMVAATAKIRPIEAELASLETQISKLGVDTALAEARLEERRQTMAGTLAALQRMAIRPPASLLVSPGDANDIVRTALLLRAAMPLIEAQAADLKSDMETMALLTGELTERRSRQSAARGELEAEAKRLVDLAGKKETLLSALSQRKETAEARITEQIGEAETLEQLLAGIERKAAQNANTADTEIFRLMRPLSGAQGKLSTPVQGRLLHRFGEANDFGGVHKGVTFAALPGAFIVAPWDGKVAFAGPFRNFGLILIIDHGEGYHSLIAGFAEIAVEVDQWVLTGEPVGMTPADFDAENTDMVRGRAADRDTGDRDTGDRDTGGRSAGGDGQDGNSNGPTLYVELRDGGSPINPLPWLAARNDKVQE